MISHTTIDAYIQKARQILQKYIDPYLGQNYVVTKALKEISWQAESQQVFVNIVLPYAAQSVVSQLQESVEVCLREALTEVNSMVNMSYEIFTPHTSTAVLPLSQVKNIIAVASGKGGVGKSTTTVNLALALQEEGAKVGVLDADIYGPNIAQMLGKSATMLTSITGDQRLQPVIAHGLQTMSMSYLVSQQDTPMVWRGPMASRALEQLARDTAWQTLDYLLIDLPPGTGDIPLTLAQKIPLNGVVIVTTPQKVATADAAKALKMFEKVKVPLLGILENMSHYVCPCCEHKEALFGSTGGSDLATTYQLPLLGQIPLTSWLCRESDNGLPALVAAPDSLVSTAYRESARLTAAKLALQLINQSKFPKISVEFS